MLGSPPTLVLGIVGVFGAAIGSWLNVVILRLQGEKPWWSGRSACPFCGTTLRWFELIPVFSFIGLRGRCRNCHRTLTKQYLIVELVTALGFILTWQFFGASWLTVPAWAVVSTMILIGVYDGRWALIPDSFSVAFIIAASAMSLISQHPWPDILIGAVAGGGFFAAQHILSKQRWVGSGDIFLGIGLGLLLGWRILMLGLFLAYMSGALVAATMILAKRLKTSSTMPFGPYLLAGGFIAWLYGQQIVDWYFNHALFM